MPDPIDREIVEEVARLANVHLSDQEIKASAQQLAEIIQYAGLLSRTDLPDAVEPFFGSVRAANPTRPDLCQPSTARSQMLRNAPESDGEFYVVPRVLHSSHGTKS